VALSPNGGLAAQSPAPSAAGLGAPPQKAWPGRLIRAPRAMTWSAWPGQPWFAAAGPISGIVTMFGGDRFRRG